MSWWGSGKGKSRLATGEIEGFEGVSRKLSVFGERRIGLEQEFFLIEEDGSLSCRADEFLARCWDATKAADTNPQGFAPECSPSMIEINTPPVCSLEELSYEYLKSLVLALKSGQEIGLRLYPLATYPLDVHTPIRDEPHYQIQAQTVGPERFLHAGRCAGVHLHLEVAPDTIDQRVGVSYDAPKIAREELLSLYNLATAFDAALIALTRSCPYYAGISDGLATRTAHYRGDPELAPYGVYAFLEEVGGLRPYAGSTEELVEMQFSRYHGWLKEMKLAGVDPGLFFQTGGALLKSSGWNPVRLNALGTVELREIDSNYPKKVLAIAALVYSAAERVRRERLRVLPCEDVSTFEVVGEKLLVPGYEYLSGTLFRAALTGGVESEEVVSYLDSILDFTRTGQEAAVESSFEVLESGRGSYRTTEADVLEDYASMGTPKITEELGRRLVLEACEKLEEQVGSLHSREATRTGANEG
jgi:Glutamate-cysteine ligase family 2(GCS2)